MGTNLKIVVVLLVFVIIFGIGFVYFRHEKENTNDPTETCFTSISGYGIDTDDNSQYNYLVAEIGINVSRAGNYTLLGSLRCGDTYITSGRGDMLESFYSALPNTLLCLDAGIHTIKLYFNGKDVYDSKISGNYSFDLILYDEDGTFIDRKTFNTPFYNHTEFQGLLIEIIQISDYVKDTDNDGLFDYLTLRVDLKTMQSGDYSIEGIMFSNKGYITSTSKHVYLDKGESVVTLDFDGLEIRQSRINSPYFLDVIVSDQNYRGMKSYDTSAYNYVDFQRPAAEFTGHYIVYGEDTKGNELYEHITAEIGIKVISTGNYRVFGWLGDIMWAENRTNLNVGDQLVLLEFNVTQVYEQGIRGPYNLTLWIHDENDAIIDHHRDVHTTWVYNHSTSQNY